MIRKSKLYILNCLIISSVAYLALVKADCQLKYPDDVEKAPLYTKYFGIYSLELPYTRQNIQLKNGEIITATCRTVFESIKLRKQHHYYSNYVVEEVDNRSSILLNCTENNLYLDGKMLHDNELNCQKLKWSIYEDNKNHKWCNEDTGAAAFLLATKANLAHHLLAQICFSLKNWSLKSVLYNATAPSDDVEVLRDVMKMQLQTVDIIGSDLWNFKVSNNFNLTNWDLQEQLSEMSQHNFWLQLANYEIEPIIQGKSYQKYFAEYSNHLNTIWWSNLRLGNWKRFMDTLETYAYNNSFQLYTGTSGVVRKPSDDNPSDKTDLIIKFGFKKKPVPAYIWTYLTSIDNTNKDFVIVGYNSPYSEFFHKSDIVFCPDICDQIPWLNKISSSFSYATAGIMFCCSTESIEQLKNLDGFPINVLNLRSLPKQENETENKDSTVNTSTTSSEKINILDTEMETTTTNYNEIYYKEIRESDKNDGNFDDDFE